MYWVTCTQPLLFPPIYMIERFARCHCVVLMQEAQFSRKANHGWALIKTPQGPFKIGPTLKKKNRRPIDEIEVLDPAGWATHLDKQLHGFYKGALGYQETRESLDRLLQSIAEARDLTLHRLNEMTIWWSLGQAGVLRRLVPSKRLVPERPLDPTQWLADLAHGAGATDYIQGVTSIQSYFQSGVFARKGMQVWGQDFDVPFYEPPDKVFDPLVSVLDPLMMCGRSWVRTVVGADAPIGSAFQTAVSMEAYA